MLSSDAWLDWQLVAEVSQSADLEKLIRMEQFKISQAKLRISKVQEGWEKGFYTAEESRTKLTDDCSTVKEVILTSLYHHLTFDCRDYIPHGQVRSYYQALRHKDILKA
jgi:hypothetical protein